MLLLIFSVRLLQIFVNERVEVTVHNSLNVAGFVVCSVVFDQGIRTKHIASYLAAPLYLLSVPDMEACSNSLSLSRRSASLLRSIHIAVSRFCIWLLSF